MPLSWVARGGAVLGVGTGCGGVGAVEGIRVAGAPGRDGESIGGRGRLGYR